MDHITTSTDTASTLADSPRAGDSQALAKAPSRSSVKTSDFGGDLDLEQQLQGGDGPQKEAGDQLDFQEKNGTSSSAQAGQSSFPATLAHDDPENPKNWSTGKKLLINFTLCIWVLSLTYSSTAYVASLRAIEARFHIGQEAAILGVSLMVFGFAAGPLVWGPMSEMLGRRLVYIITGIFYTAFSFGAAFSPNAGGLLVFRFLIGFFGSASINNVPASIGDYTSLAERGPYSILYALMAFGGPALGPLASSFIQSDVGFHWNLRVMAIFSGIMSLLVVFVPETHGPTLLKWRIKKEGNAPPALSARQVVTVYKVALARPIVYLFTEPLVTLVCVFLSLLYGCLYGFFEAFTVVYLEKRGMKSTSYGLTYISLGIGFLLACILLATVGNRSYLKAAKAAADRGEKTPPEARLTLAYPGAILAPISLFIFAWTAPFPHIHWAVPCLAELLFGMSMLLIFTAFIPYLIDNMLSTAASALAAGMASRALLGGLFPLFSLQMYHKLTVQGATSLLAGICLCLAPIPFIFKRYGHKLREKSKHAGL